MLITACAPSFGDKVLCCTMLCSAVLCCTVLYYSVVSFSLLFLIVYYGSLVFVLMVVSFSLVCIFWRDVKVESQLLIEKLSEQDNPYTIIAAWVSG